MEQNQNAHGAFAAGADEAAALPHWPGASWSAPPAVAESAPEDEHDFASEAEATAYWQGLSDGIRQSGGIVPARLAARLRREEKGLLVPVHGDTQILPGSGRWQTEGLTEGSGASEARCVGTTAAGPSTTACGSGPPPRSGADQVQDTLAFAPANLRPRHDGWSPEKQIAFVEALAETGIVRQAAAQVRMDPRSVSRLRRRPDARAFDRACTAAARIGGRNLLSIAYERAVEGTIKRHYFHGELKAEERVYDNRLLMALIARLPRDDDEADPATQNVEQNWAGWMDAIARGRDAPEPPAASEPPAEPVEYAVWRDEGDLLTNCPPPDDFDGYENGEPGDRSYQRRLTAAEEDYWQQEGENAANRDGSTAGDWWIIDGPDFFAKGCGLSGLSEAAEPEEEQSEASEASSKRRLGSADGSPSGEPDRRHGFAGTPKVAEQQDEASEAGSACGERRPSPADGSHQPNPIDVTAKFILSSVEGPGRPR